MYEGKMKLNEDGKIEGEPSSRLRVAGEKETGPDRS
jgi:hypothetical protein